MKHFLSIIFLGLTLVTNTRAQPSISLSLLLDPFGTTFQVTAAQIKSMVVERSQDLTTWQPYIDVFFTENVVEFRDRTLQSPAPDRAFYKATADARPTSEMLAQWQGLGVSYYKFDFSRTCLCNPGTISATITVQNGQVVAVDNPQPQYTTTADYPTLDQLFGYIAELIQYSDVVAIRYDPDFFFPQWIEAQQSKRRREILRWQLCRTRIRFTAKSFFNS
jgi:hypothetical protein